jgi:RNA recognition motif-containing protein
VKADKLQPRKKSAGFISFDTPDQAKVALSAMNGAGAQGFKMKVSYHRPNLNPAEKRDLAAQ